MTVIQQQPVRRKQQHAPTASSSEFRPPFPFLDESVLPDKATATGQASEYNSASLDSRNIAMHHPFNEHSPSLPVDDAKGKSPATASSDASSFLSSFTPWASSTATAWPRPSTSSLSIDDPSRRFKRMRIGDADEKKQKTAYALKLEIDHLNVELVRKQFELECRLEDAKPLQFATPPPVVEKKDAAKEENQDATGSTMASAPVSPLLPALGRTESVKFEGLTARYPTNNNASSSPATPRADVANPPYSASWSTSYSYEDPFASRPFDASIRSDGFNYTAEDVVDHLQYLETNLASKNAEFASKDGEVELLRSRLKEVEKAADDALLVKEGVELELEEFKERVASKIRRVEGKWESKYKEKCKEVERLDYTLKNGGYGAHGALGGEEGGGNEGYRSDASFSSFADVGGRTPMPISTELESASSDIG
ncbi:hypothetical protein JCM8547_001905 [Rhodosporidiobolus lusitaniae]